MKLSKIVIENFKSIKRIEFDVKKYGNSHTTVFLGVNESGKSNILQAMSFLDTPTHEYDYNIIHNQKDDENNPINMWFYLEFEDKNLYLEKIKTKFKNGDKLNFTITNIIKNVYLDNGQTTFDDDYEFSVKNLPKNLYIKKYTENKNINGQTKSITSFELANNNDDEQTFQELTEETFLNYFQADIKAIIRKNEPTVSFWKPSEEYLISIIDLNKFKDDVNSNIPLKHIFALAGYKSSATIKSEIEKISNDQLRRKLMYDLSTAATKYIKNIWKHKISLDIEINDSGKCTVSVKDDGGKNKHNFHKMTVRSEGFKQFISLILSLSIETKKLGVKNSLILIDEAEAHLHPSGIRDLKDELLEIGKDNYLFVSTHSPFLVDRNSKERNIIINKNNSALTEKKEIKSEEDIRDDEVLDLAFGINVYKDLLIPHRILVEGGTDKTLLQKAFKLKKFTYGITNGTGNNIVKLASRFNYDDIQILVIVDDDNEGNKYKEEILKIGGNFNKDNVFTLRDLVGETKSEGTIEDLLGKEYVENKFKEYYKTKFDEEIDKQLNDSPFIPQIKKILVDQSHYTKQILDEFKKILSDDFNPTKTSLENNFPLLNSLATKIQENLNN